LGVKRPVRLVALVTAAVLVPIVVFAGLSLRRQEPPLSLLRKASPYKVERGWQHYRLTMTADSFLKQCEPELRSPTLEFGSADYAGDEGLECWTYLKANEWTIEFREMSKPKAQPVLEVHALREPPAWLSWIQEKLGFAN